jgi:hypothetical protein
MGERSRVERFEDLIAWEVSRITGGLRSSIRKSRVLGTFHFLLSTFYFFLLSTYYL